MTKPLQMSEHQSVDIDTPLKVTHDILLSQFITKTQNLHK